MRRATRKFLAIANRLDAEIDKDIDIFFRERPFLEYNVEPVFTSKTDEEIEEKVDNIIAIEQIVKRIGDLVYER